MAKKMPNSIVVKRKKPLNQEELRDAAHSILDSMFVAMDRLEAGKAAFHDEPLFRLIQQASEEWALRERKYRPQVFEYASTYKRLLPSVKRFSNTKRISDLSEEIRVIGEKDIHYIVSSNKERGAADLTLRFVGRLIDGVFMEPRAVSKKIKAECLMLGNDSIPNHSWGDLSGIPSRQANGEYRQALIAAYICEDQSSERVKRISELIHEEYLYAWSRKFAAQE